MRTVEQNWLTPNSRIYEALEPCEQVFPKKQQHNTIIVIRKLEMHMEQAQYDQAKRNEATKHGLTKNKQSLK